jgi:hypothetical protein
MNWASSTAAVLIRVTKVPNWGTICTKRSSRRRISASRIGVRLTARRSASSFSDSRCPARARRR